MAQKFKMLATFKGRGAHPQTKGTYITFKNYYCYFTLGGSQVKTSKLHLKS